jgi:hypothetical protein
MTALLLVQALSEDQAVRAVWDRPEVQAWAERVRKHEGVRPVSMAQWDAAEVAWHVGLFESHETHLVRWATFQVDGRSGRPRRWNHERDGWGDP